MYAMTLIRWKSSAYGKLYSLQGVKEFHSNLNFQGKKPDDPRCVVEGVISSIRANGFLVFIPRYALKGPVFLQNAEKPILFVRKNVGPVWEDGSLIESDHGIVVQTNKGKQVYKLFDHVTVTIQVIMIKI